MLGGWWCDAHALCARRRAQTCPPPPTHKKSGAAPAAAPPHAATAASNLAWRVGPQQMLVRVATAASREGDRASREAPLAPIGRHRRCAPRAAPPRRGLARRPHPSSTPRRPGARGGTSPTRAGKPWGWRAPGRAGAGRRVWGGVGCGWERLCGCLCGGRRGFGLSAKRGDVKSGARAMPARLAPLRRARRPSQMLLWGTEGQRMRCSQTPVGAQAKSAWGAGRSCPRA